MKSLVLIILLGSVLQPALASTLPHLVRGTWQYDGFQYQGHRYPNPNPDLILNFTFMRRVSHLIWHRVNELGFCERKAIFRLHKDMMYQKVTWLNPKNNSDCSMDPDMQMNKETDVRFDVDETTRELHLFLDLNGQEFIYILRRIDPIETNGPSPSHDGSFSSI